MRTFYRICKPETGQGLWYDTSGEFTGLIHSAYDFCKAAALPMPFDPDLVGWLSATESQEEFYNWFSRDEVFRLQQFGYYIHLYEATDIKFYEPYQHTVINQATSRVIGRILVNRPHLTAA